MLRLFRKKKIISVVIALYNCERYIAEALESVLNQLEDPLSMEVIVVDDGSTDASLEICKKYSAKYPKIIKVVSKEHKGAGSARNEGIKIARGKYLSFLDADDYLSPGCLSEATEFLNANLGIDIVSFPIFYFEAKTGPHKLNRKFTGESRIVDLTQCPETIQLSASASVFRTSALKGIFFDEDLLYAEDSKLIQQVLLKTKKIGLMADRFAYNYRRRNESVPSLIQMGPDNCRWYLEYMDHYQLWILDYCKRTENFPDFIKHTLLHDLKYHIFDSKAESILSQIEAKEYYEKIRTVLQSIDDGIIVSQENYSYEQRILTLRLKYGNKYQLLKNNEGVFIKLGNTHLPMRRIVVRVLDVSINEETLTIKGRYNKMLDEDYELTVSCEASGVVGRVIDSRSIEQKSVEGITLYNGVVFEYSILLDELPKEEVMLKMQMNIDGVAVNCITKEASSEANLIETESAEDTIISIAKRGVVINRS